ncbi:MULTISPECIES: superoxide dismutase [Halomonadaceae]|uniref:superoxide dismutase n=1 Tax=Halomonadaceae TaxID=28256 RepID=UPI001598B6F0|nr:MULTISPECIES: Fe-Mn family superoxide dismutase [Halomonas]QJQ96653.1 superoxide dismutase [Fe] [Halomonas sp. PA5]
MAFELPALPYEKHALEPLLSSETLEYHHGKHHQESIATLNRLIAGTPDDNKSLEALIASSSGALFDHAAEAWNHTFYWHCLSPQGEGAPGGDLAVAIETAFGSFDGFKERFTTQAMQHFGAGWVWLIKSLDGKLEIVTTTNADTPIAHRQIPLLGIDLWEHAYYIDYRHFRDKYLESLWRLINWDFVALNHA